MLPGLREESGAAGRLPEGCRKAAGRLPGGSRKARGAGPRCSREAPGRLTGVPGGSREPGGTGQYPRDRIFDYFAVVGLGLEIVPPAPEIRTGPPHFLTSQATKYHQKISVLTCGTPPKPFCIFRRASGCTNPWLGALPGHLGPRLPR